MSGEQIRIFLDACVFIAVIKSSSGGSALILELYISNRFQLVTTKEVLLEAYRNIKNKFSEEELVKFYQEIASLNLEIADTTTTQETLKYSHIIHKKDSNVLAAAIKSRAAIMITLDRKHFMTPAIKKANLPISILTPGELIQQINNEIGQQET